MGGGEKGEIMVKTQFSVVDCASADVGVGGFSVEDAGGRGEDGDKGEGGGEGETSGFDLSVNEMRIIRVRLTDRCKVDY